MAVSKCEPSIGSSLAGVTPASRRFTSANAVVTVFYAPNTPIAARSRRAFYISLPALDIDRLGNAARSHFGIRMVSAFWS